MIKDSELSAYLQANDVKLSSKEISELIKEIDYQGNGKINYSEFLTATIDVEKYLTE
jgi:Ca2+-binding EF-hand superfamily protein